MKLLITGGFGYLGGRLAQYLATRENYEIILGTRKQVKTPEWLPRAKVEQTQWRDLASLEKNCKGVDVIVHLAGMNAQDCAADPLAALEVNAVATARLLRAAVRQRVKRFIYLSTAHVYGNPLSGDITEETCPVSLHPYATSHRAGEDVVRAAHQQGKIEGVVIRLSNAFGPPAHIDVNCWMLLVNDLCKQAVTTGCMVLRSSGLQRRDFITLTDACKASRHLLELPSEKLGDGLFNVGGAWSPTILEMTERVAERIFIVTNIKLEIVRKAEPNAEYAAMLNYSIKKLKARGFKMRQESSVDQEIDSTVLFLLQACAKKSTCVRDEKFQTWKDDNG